MKSETPQVCDYWFRWPSLRDSRCCVRRHCCDPPKVVCRVCVVHTTSSGEFLADDARDDSNCPPVFSLFELTENLKKKWPISRFHSAQFSVPKKSQKVLIARPQALPSGGPPLPPPPPRQQVVAALAARQSAPRRCHWSVASRAPLPLPGHWSASARGHSQPPVVVCPRLFFHGRTLGSNQRIIVRPM
jgi:hypothetical protein